MDDDPTPHALPPSQWALNTIADDEPTTPHAAADAAAATPTAAAAAAGSPKAERSPLLPRASEAPSKEPLMPPAPTAPPPLPPPPRASGPPVRRRGASCACVSVVVSNFVALALVLASVAVSTEARGSGGSCSFSGGGPNQTSAIPLCGGSGGGDHFSLYFFTAFSYAIYLFVALRSPAAGALRNAMSQPQLDAFVERLRRARPRVAARIQNYHYETHTTRESHTDSSGNTTYSSSTKRVRVNTHAAEAEWSFAGVCDVSGPPVYQPHLRALLVQIHAVQDFSDASDRAAFDAWLQGFYRTHTRDAEQDRSCGMVVPGFCSHVMLVQGRGVLLSCGAHLAATLLLGGAAYELCLVANVPTCRWLLVKQLRS